MAVGLALYGLMTTDSWGNFAKFVEQNCGSSEMYGLAGMQPPAKQAKPQPEVEDTPEAEPTDEAGDDNPYANQHTPDEDAAAEMAKGNFVSAYFNLLKRVNSNASREDLAHGLKVIKLEQSRLEELALKGLDVETEVDSKAADLIAKTEGLLGEG